MRRLLIRLRAAYRYVKALNLRFQKDFSGALKELAELGPELHFHLRVRMLLLRGAISGHEEKYRAAHADLLEAFNLVAKISKRYSETDKLYMKSFASELGLLIGKKLNKQSGVFEVYYDQIDLRDVSRDLIKYFPLLDHPQWDEFRASQVKK
jgi:hypothetical protein